MKSVASFKSVHSFTKLLLAALVAILILIAARSAAGQTTAPAQSGHQRVLVFPFTQVSAPGKLDWLSHGIQEDILTELNSSRGMQAIAPPAGQDTPPADMNAAVEQGKKVDASYVIYGNFQASDTELRISGHVVDVQIPQANVARLKVTGPLNNVFNMEDALDNQVESAVGLAPPQPPQSAAAPNYPPPNYQTPSYEPPNYQPSDNTYSSPYDNSDYNYLDQSPYYYPSYSYGYTPYYYGGYYYPFFGFSNAHFHFHDHGFIGHNGFHNGFNNGFHGNMGGFHGNMGGNFHGGMGGGGGFHGGGMGGGGGHR